MGTWCAIVSDMKVAERLAEHFDGETRPTGEPSRIEVTVGVTPLCQPPVRQMELLSH